MGHFVEGDALDVREVVARQHDDARPALAIAIQQV
jgi:hypothetical protein